MTVNELYCELDRAIPASLSCDWDNDGLMCCPDGDAEVRRVLVALDVTADVVDEAISGGYDVIISHHPFIFSGLKSLCDSDFIPRKAMDLIREEVAVMSFHTRLDALDGGVNDTLAYLIGLENTTPFGDGDETIGRVGELDEEMHVADFAKKIKRALGAPSVLYTDCGKRVKRVAILGGDGKDFLSAAIAAGADTYVSGNIGYHNMTDAPDMNINLIEAGHFYTENPVCEVLAGMIRELDIECDVYFSNRIYAV